MEPALLIRRRTLLLGATLAGCRRRRGTGFPGYALVASPEARAVAVVYLTNFGLAGQIRLPASPGLVLAHPTRPAAWCLSQEAGTLYELDPSRLASPRALRVARSALAMRRTPDAAALWVLCRDPRQLVCVDAKSFQCLARIPLPAEPLDFDLSPDGRTAAVSLAQSGAVLFGDLTSGRAGPPHQFGRRAATVRFRSDGKLLMAANADQSALSILEAPGGGVVVHLPLAMRPEHFCFNSDGGQLFLTGPGADAVAVVFPYRTEVAETLLAGRSPSHMAVSAAPEYLFVASPAAGDVAVLEIETRRVIALAPVGEGAGPLAVTPDNQYLLALNRRTGAMAVIRIAAIVARRTRVAPLFTVVPVGPRPAALAVCRI